MLPDSIYQDPRAERSEGKNTCRFKYFWDTIFQGQGVLRPLLGTQNNLFRTLLNMSNLVPHRRKTFQK